MSTSRSVTGSLPPRRKRNSAMAGLKLAKTSPYRLPCRLAFRLPGPLPNPLRPLPLQLPLPLPLTLMLTLLPVLRKPDAVVVVGCSSCWRLKSPVSCSTSLGGSETDGAEGGGDGSIGGDRDGERSCALALRGYGICRRWRGCFSGFVSRDRWCKKAEPTGGRASKDESGEWNGGGNTGFGVPGVGW